jgi:6-pyruvoyltetrahydropterin/6-carboxytetrahydropterin synthase
LFTISKRFSFSASHQLTHLPADHPCARLHGHNYTVEVILTSPCLDDRGFCQADYRELEPFRRLLADELDHRHLNEALPIRPTAENLARYLHGRAKQLCPHVVAVRVGETPETSAEYRA